MKKGKLRVCIVKGSIYKWIVDEKEVRIYNENKMLYRVNKDKIFTITDYDGYYNNPEVWGEIRPKMVHSYIEKNFK